MGSGGTEMLRAEPAPPSRLTGGDAFSGSARGGEGNAGAGNAGVAPTASTESPGFLEGRKRKLEEALGNVCKSLDSLDDFISRGKRRGGREGDCCAHLSLEGSSRAGTREGRVGGSEAMEELLETIARVGDERVLRQARSRAEAADDAPTHHAEGASAAASAGAVSNDPSALDPRQHADGGLDALASRLESSGERFEITRWRRSLVRRVSSAAVAGSGCELGEDARDGGVSAAGGSVGLMWRVQVSGACCGLAFSLSFLVSQEADWLHLEGLEVGDPGAAVDMAPLLQSINASMGAEGGVASGGARGAAGAATGGGESGGEVGSRGDGGSGEEGGRGEGGGEQGGAEVALVGDDGACGDGHATEGEEHRGRRAGGGGMMSGEGGGLQDVMRSLSVYGAVARRRADVLEEAAQRFRGTVSATHAGGPLDFSSVRFCSHSTGMSLALS